MVSERPRPIVKQVSQILRQRIEERFYAPAERLPSESELAQELNVSRATIRTVLAELAGAGLIFRRQGDGTYVNEHIEGINTRLGGMLDYSRLISSSGFEPTIEPLALEQRRATETEKQALKMPASDVVLVLTRRFLASGRPVILVSNALPAALFSEIPTLRAGQLPLHQFLTQYANQEIAYAIYDLKATLAGDQGAALQVSSGTPLLQLHAIFYNAAGQPVACGESVFNHNILPLRLVQTWSAGGG